MARRIGTVRSFAVTMLAGLLIAGGFLAARQFEWHDPAIATDLEGDAIGLKPFNVIVTDRGKGLAHVAVSLITGDRAQNLYFEEYDAAPNERIVRIQLDPSQINLTEGPALLRVTAVDRSYWGFFRGNKAVVDKPVRVDLTPPSIEVVSDDRYVTSGGSAFIVYRTSADTRNSGIRIGRHRFPAYKGYVGDAQTFMAFFAHPYDVPGEERASILAEDHAGNIAEHKLSYDLRNVRYRAVNVKISEDFIANKIRPLLSENKSGALSAAEQFVAVNRELREQNESTISQACSSSKPQKMWDGPFMQLSNSQVQANFADQRSYVYGNDIIDRAYHLGYDLAVTRRYPVEAANGGIVVFAGPLGIYGNTVILDHGFGVCTLYSHLSSMHVAVGDRVSKGHNIGRTGETGLATGDHLHYAVYIHGVPVLPLEWWDAKWINDNVLSKLDPEISEARGNVLP